jgi:8-amino-7-oxononanoate synthase
MVATPVLARPQRTSSRLDARISAMWDRIQGLRSDGVYAYNQSVEELSGPATVRIGGRDLLMLSSYSYLGLNSHPAINKAAGEAIERWGTGTHGARLLAGSLSLHDELEHAVAGFKGTEEAISFSSGYAANLAAVSTLVGHHDVVLCDKLNHASIYDGCALSGAELRRFNHNDLGHLERLLVRSATRETRLVVVDAVFSMQGDIVDLPGVVQLCRRHGAFLVVDEAHSMGVLGATGRGIEEHFGIRGGVDLKMGTFSKAIPSMGGFLAGDRRIVNLLRHAARPYMFSGALPPAQAAAALTALRVMESEPEHLERLRGNTSLFLALLAKAGFDVNDRSTPIVPISCGEDQAAFAMSALCDERGLFVLPVVSPAVPKGAARLRATVTAAHSEQQIEWAVDTLSWAARELRLI